MSVRVAVLVSNHSEDMELVVPVDIWRRAGILVKLISIQKKKNLILQNGIKVTCDEIIQKENFSKYRAIFLPGGKGRNDFKSELATKFINFANKNIHNPDIWFLGICGAAEVYSDLNLLGKTKVTCHPACIEKCRKNYQNKPVVVDGNFITANAAGAAIDFALTVVEKLVSKQKAIDVAKEIVYKWN